MTVRKRVLWLLAAIALLGWPWLTDDKFLHHVGVLICLTSIAAASLHLIIRTGHVSLCHTAFMAFGAYGSVIAVMRFGMPWPVGLLAGMALAAAVAAVIGPIVLRLTGKYFVLITFLMGEVVRMAIVENSWLTGGSNGIFDVPPPYPFLLSNRAYYYFALAFAVLGVGFCARLLASEFGRAMDAIREGERLAECSGVPVIRFKVTVFVIACALAGMTGSLQAHYIKFVGPDAYSGFQSLNLVVMNVIGGMSSLIGAHARHRLHGDAARIAARLRQPAADHVRRHPVRDHGLPAGRPDRARPPCAGAALRPADPSRRRSRGKCAGSAREQVPPKTRAPA